MTFDLETKSLDMIEIYDAEAFRAKGYKIIDILADYLKKAASNKITQVLPPLSPDEMLGKWQDKFPENPSNNLEEILKKVINLSNHLHSPQYIGHQVSSPVPNAALADIVSSLLNNGTAIYEMGSVSTILEKRIIQWMAGLIGYDNSSDGFLTSGGTLGNLTALLAARQAKSSYDIWTEGVKEQESLAFLVSAQTHYSAKRAIQVMGLGEKAVIPVETNENYQMTVPAIQEAYDSAVKSGKKVIAIVANACSTATVSYDPLEEIAEFCKKHDLWLHVDGAHGASALISDKYKDLLKGIEQADSVVWDAHKMMLMPALITAVIFKNSKASYEAFSQKASYLFEKEAHEEWYNLAQRTMECTKNMMGLKLYLSLMTYGTKFFGDYITKMYDLTKKCADIIKNSPDFELAIEPQSNIICFRYINNDSRDTNELQKQIRKDILKKATFYIVQTQLKDKIYLRCTIINPLTTEQHFKDLMQEVRDILKLSL
ncbi:MAG: aminotransferase class I/II-fold pyridoxal phosphate-dependent enzyme [Crenarchaeota archaeon]|nr:aminotransferase class I/II-fold pyridoxal phosphate-dependent enzyme [Thermoproteota archaeon]